MYINIHLAHYKERKRSQLNGCKGISQITPDRALQETHQGDTMIVYPVEQHSDKHHLLAMTENAEKIISCRHNGEVAVCLKLRLSLK